MMAYHFSCKLVNWQNSSPSDNFKKLVTFLPCFFAKNNGVPKPTIAMAPHVRFFLLASHTRSILGTRIKTVILQAQSLYKVLYL